LPASGVNVDVDDAPDSDLAAVEARCAVSSSRLLRFFFLRPSSTSISTRISCSCCWNRKDDEDEAEAAAVPRPVRFLVVIVAAAAVVA
jgi:hypothetical protein